MCLFGNPAQRVRHLLPELGSVVPDLFAEELPEGAIIGWRTWNLGFSALSGLYGATWHPNTVMKGLGLQRGNSTGVYAYSAEMDVAYQSDSYNVTLFGEVLLWGTLMEYDRFDGSVPGLRSSTRGVWGWRAEYAYPLSLFYPGNLSKTSGKRLEVLKAYAETGVIINHKVKPKLGKWTWEEHSMSYKLYKQRQKEGVTA